MTTPRPSRPKATGKAVLALTTVAGITAGTAALVGFGMFFGFDANLPRVEFNKPSTRPAPPTPVPSVAIMRPLPIPSQGRQAIALRATDGQFYFETAVSGTGIRMMFDTGASLVALRAEDAARAGIAVNALDYNITINTANGTSRAAPVMLETVRVGDIVRRDVAAMVLKPGKLGISLLGQSFMSKLSGYRHEKGELILQAD